MTGFPILSGKKLLRVLLKCGFVALRRKGSHVFVENGDGSRGTAIPIHGNEDLGIGLLKDILSDLNISAEDLRGMLRGK